MYGGWVNPVYDQLIDDARRTADKQERIRLYTEAEKLIHQEAPKVRTAGVHNVSAWQKNLQSYRPNVVGNMTYKAGGFRTAWLTKP